MLICSEFAECFELEPVDFVDVESYDGVRSYPVLKVSFMPKSSKKNAKPKIEHNLNKIVQNDKVSNAKSEIVDNVREFAPMSREDIRKLKKLTFHGRSSPTALSSTQPNDNSTNSILRQLPVQVNYQERKYTQQQTNSNRNVPKNTHSYEDKGFQPLMRPSPINVHPVDEPSFQTTRNYVDYLKIRQKQFFADLLKDDNTSDEEYQHEKQHENQHETQQSEIPGEVLGEVDYFIKREKELADEQRPLLINKNPDVTNVDPYESNGEIEGSDVREYESKEEEESRKHERFVPFRLYAQVRHVEADHHAPRSKAPSPKATEKLTLEKKNIYYKEEGYEEKDYDHGAEKVSAKYRHRSRRAVNDTPVALPIIIKQASPKVSGENVLKHLDELLKESTLYLPDDIDDFVATEKRPSETIYGTNDRNSKSHKYPYYNLPDSNTLNTMSAYRYSENMKNFPQAKQSLYNFKNVRECQEIDQDVNPVPDDIDEKGKSTKFNESPQRLKNLGDKIGCFKDKFFGKDPFDNPLFKEKYVTASIPIPLKESSFLLHQANPLITVYDDVISNIRAAFADELRQKREQESLASQPIVVKPAVQTATKPEVKLNSLSSAPAVSRLPQFDISNYYPKLSNPASEEKPFKPPTKVGYEVDFIEVADTERATASYKNKISNAPKKVAAVVIKNLRPPNFAEEKRRRRNPIANNKAFQVPRFQPPSHFLQPPTTPKNKFKLL